ncbi:MAG: GNAT family N-acetyltransferase [Gracilibacteraceae bacterium]|nr:GNAT family N-acetyltransferase [Gracilibacteraceae bacterium]
METTLRLEKKSDWKTVEQITYRAFHDAPPAGANDDGMEALLARKLRSCAAFVPKLDYVAELNGSVIGSIMYTRSKVAGDGGEWETLTFGPVSVLPKYQRGGVGSALIRQTLEIARELGYRAVLIFGHESYYPRFGFRPASEFGITTADGENFPAFMALPLYDGALDGVCGRLICDEVYFALNKAESDALNATLAEPMDIDEYIDAQPLAVQPILRRVRGAIQSAAPEAIEKISWQMPTFWRGHNLIHFAAQKKHFGIYPGTEAMTRFASRLEKYKTSKGAIQFPYQTFGDEQLALISEIAACCSATISSISSRTPSSPVR